MARGIQFFLKRVFDFVTSAVLLVILSPLFLLIALSIRLSSSGPVLYEWNVVGKNGKPFKGHKFRTMVQNADELKAMLLDRNEMRGPVFKLKDDPRVTPVGRVLRKFSLDELPQLWSVLKGDMSLVGPRPERPHFVKKHKALHELRLAVKPGLTGLAQIRSFYDLKPQHKIRYDYLYIQKRSLLLNLYILLRTIPAVFSRKGW